MSKDKGAMIAKITHGVPENEGGEGGPLRDYFMTWHDMTNRGKEFKNVCSALPKQWAWDPWGKQ